jgi:2-amino-4-hydroxy-6-hydroxymethyldihydropteridine diphosphokinase
MRAAVDALGYMGDVVAVSSLWETAPMGGPDQGDYLNAVAVVRTVLGPVPLLRRLLGVEQSRGRERRERWMPRTLDLDLLLYEDAVVDAPGLIVPHPRLHQRRFVLEPLREAWPGAVVPGLGPVEDLLPGVAGQRGEVVAGPDWVRVASRE